MFAIDFALLNYIKSNKNKYAYNKRVEDSIKYIKENYAKKIKIEDISRVVGLSKWHYIRLFKRLKGLTPIEFLTVLRLEKAKELLKIDYKSNIKEVAEKCGYPSPLHFSEIFKKKIGVSPRQYRKQ